jgi:hypothetical protein
VQKAGTLSEPPAIFLFSLLFHRSPFLLRKKYGLRRWPLGNACCRKMKMLPTVSWQKNKEEEEEEEDAEAVMDGR